MTFILFHSNGVLQRRESMPTTNEDRMRYGIYDDTYVFVLPDRAWYRPDLTPVLLNDVPKEHRAALLILNI